MAKDKKAKAAEKKARTAAKQEKKSSKKEKKHASKAKANADDSDAEGDVDLDAVLAEYARQQALFHAVTETACEPPSARSSSTLVASPANEHELFLFGGEHFNGALAKFHNDLFVYHTAKDVWHRVDSPNSPLPRSGHAWTRGGNAGGIWLFGGEFSSPKQGTFYHYNDFWTLDPRSREWTRLEEKGKNKGPPARSGHRMTYFKQYILLFGGFQDTSQQTRYLNDLWLYDTQNYCWIEPKLATAGGRPDPRSSFTFLPHERGAVLYGGYSRVKATAGGPTAKQVGKGAHGHSRTVLKPVVHQDTWFLRIEPPASDAAAGTAPKVWWERRKKPANAPSPPRAGATMAAHRGRGILFGGVHDVEESEEGIESEFFDQLFVWNVERNRFFPLALRRPRAGAGKRQQQQQDLGRGAGGRRGRGKADEEELLRNLRELEMKGRVAGVDGEGAEAEADGVRAQAADESDEEPDEKKAPKPVTFEMPHPRFNAQLAVQGDVLYIFGGTFEKGDREYTFDELWAVDLGKLDGVREIFRRELEDWVGSDDEDDDEDDEEDDDESEEEDGEDAKEELAAEARKAPAAEPVDDDEEVEEDNGPRQSPSSSSSDPDNTLPYPRPFESLRAFYARTSVAWQEQVVEQLSRAPRSNLAHVAGGVEAMLVKEIKKMAFDRAEQAWWDAREDVLAREAEQEEAGIGEVVSLAEKGGAGAAGAAGSGVGRRR